MFSTSQVVRRISSINSINRCNLCLEFPLAIPQAVYLRLPLALPMSLAIKVLPRQLSFFATLVMRHGIGGANWGRQETLGDFQITEEVDIMRCHGNHPLDASQRFGRKLAPAAFFKASKRLSRRDDEVQRPPWQEMISISLMHRSSCNSSEGHNDTSMTPCFL